MDKEKQNLQYLLQEEMNHRNNLESRLKQTEVSIFLSFKQEISIRCFNFQHDLEIINTSRSQLQEQTIELQNERMVKMFFHLFISIENKIIFYFRIYYKK